MSYLTIHSLRGLGADTPATTTPAPVAESDNFEQAVTQAAAAATSWWDAMPEYKRAAIITGATSAAVFYWLSRIMGSVFGKK